MPSHTWQDKLSSRMDKYYKEKTVEESRTKKNRDIYSNPMEDAFEDLSLTSNISVIDADIENLDLEKLKEYLDERYKKEEKPKIDPIDEFEEEAEEELVDTKEYDLKRIIEEAHKNKEVDYDKDRFKKLRDTQYDILKNLNIEKNDEFDVKTLEEDKTLDASEKEDEGGLFYDLIGNDNTEVMAPTPDEKLATSEIKDFVEENIEKIETEEAEKTKEIENDDEETQKDSVEVKPSLNEEIEKTLKLSKKQIEEAEEIEKSSKDDDEENLNNTQNNHHNDCKHNPNNKFLIIHNSSLHHPRAKARLFIFSYFSLIKYYYLDL